jgi:hypothetical protein
MPSCHSSQKVHLKRNVASPGITKLLDPLLAHAAILAGRGCQFQLADPMAFYRSFSAIICRQIRAR